MKALILSDVHSNIYALEAIWGQEKDSDLIYCAGDLVDKGPFPKETLKWVREHNVTSVQGNHDLVVAKKYHEDELWELSGDDYHLAHHNARQLDEEEISYLENLPEYISFELDGIAYVMQHRYNYSYDTIQSLYQFKEFWDARVEESLQDYHKQRLIFGHTHRCCIHYLSESKSWLNPGSASYCRPDDPDEDAHYMTIIDGKINFKKVVFNRKAILDAIKKTDINDGELGVMHTYFG